MRLEPIGDHIIVERESEKNVSEGGIIIPDCAKEKSIVATIIAVGRGRRLSDGKRVKPEVKPGWLVAVAKFAGGEVQCGGRTYLLVKEGDIQGRITE